MDAVLDTNLTGLYQISNDEAISKYDLVSLIVHEFKLPIKVNKVEGTVCDKSIFNSVRSDFVYKVPSYKQMIYEIHAFMDSHKSFYKQYLGE